MSTNIALILLVLAVDLFLYGLYCNSYIHGGTIWNIVITPTKKQRRFHRIGKMLTAIGLVGAISLAIHLLGSVIVLYFFNSAICIIVLCVYALVLLLSAKLTFVFAWKKGLKLLYDSDEKNAMALEGVLGFSLIDSNIINDLKYFVVSLDGIYFFNETNCCYFTLNYGTYGLYNLQTTQEIALVGLYFVQKYGKQFSFKIDYYRDENAISNRNVKSYIFYKNKEK